MTILRTLFILLVSALSSGCAVLMPRLLPFDDLPRPSGRYAVGTQILQWTDENRVEWFTATADDKRRLVLQIWYPTEQATGPAYTYVDHPEQRLTPLAKQMGLPRFLIEHIQKVNTNGITNAAPAMVSSKAPVILFSHGLGGMKSQNSVQAEELASQGYFVVAVDHPFDAYLTIFDDGSTADYRSAEPRPLSPEEFWAFRGPQLATRTADMKFLLDELTRLNDSGDALWRMLDLDRIGIMGHSFGGATSIMAAASDPRIKATIALDGWIIPIPEEQIGAGLRTPFLYIGQSRWDDPVNYQKLDQLLTNSSSESRKILLEGTKHFDFSDTPQFSAFTKRLGISGSLPREELRLRLNTEITDFFATHLKADQS